MEIYRIVRLEFVFFYQKEEIHDAWLDDIDWTNVKNYKLKNPQATDEVPENPPKQTNSRDEDTVETKFNQANVIKAMLAIMQPGESVTRTIKRLGAVLSK